MIVGRASPAKCEQDDWLEREACQGTISAAARTDTEASVILTESRYSGGAMALWRILGELPQAKSREEIRAQSLDGWSPWQNPWSRSKEPDIVIPDSEDPKRFRHAQIYWVEREGCVFKFAVDHLESGGLRFLIPSETAERDAFEGRNPRYEGFWKSSSDSDENLPWPWPDPRWLQRTTFLRALDRIEVQARKISYRGFSHCRLCGCRNGSRSFQFDIWKWPEGFRHYVADHEVRPSSDFEIFISSNQMNGMT